jgi:hypothetical protein
LQGQPISEPRCASILIAALSLALPAQAMGPVAFGPGLQDAGWSELTFRGRPPAEFRAQAPGTLRVRTDGGVSVLYRPLPASFGPAAEARWRWRVDAAVPPTDLGRRGADDRALAVYFLFAGRPGGDRRSAREPECGDAAGPRARLCLGRRRRGAQRGREPAHGRARQADRSAPRGKPERRMDRGGGRPAGRLPHAFGREPGPLVGIAVSADSDDTASVSEALIADLVLR